MTKIASINDPNKPKDRYKITNWKAYNAGLKRRGSLTLWVDEKIAKRWYHKGPATRGGQLMYSEECIHLVVDAESDLSIAIQAVGWFCGVHF